MVDGKIETGSEEMEPLNRHGENERSEQTSVEKMGATRAPRPAQTNSSRPAKMNSSRHG
jgi:hypothetical protein